MNPAIWIPSAYFGISLVVWVGYVVLHAIDGFDDLEDFVGGFMCGLFWGVLLPFLVVTGIALFIAGCFAREETTATREEVGT